jgi:polyphosphate kinase 2 (PPK2 family)
MLGYAHARDIITMLAGTDFTQRISKKKYKSQMSILKERLVCLQKASWDAGLPVIILLEGWETVPKGGLIRSLTEPLDPRGFVFHAIRSPLAYEKARPWMWRFWLKIPERGQWAIFDQSWYRRVLLERNQEKIGARNLRRAFRDINDFERTLSDDGTLILKFFLHTEKAEFKLITGLAAHQLDASSESAIEPKPMVRRYDALHEIYQDALRHTHTDWAPWVIIPTNDKRHARCLFLKTIVKTLSQKLDIPCKPKQSKAKQANPTKKKAAAEDLVPEPAQTPPPTTSPSQQAADIDAQGHEQPPSSENVSPSNPKILAKQPSTAPQLSTPDDQEAPDDNVPGAGPVSIS